MLFLRISLLVLLHQLHLSQSYKPVVFMHGVFSSGEKAKHIFQWINESHPGTDTFTVNMYENKKSITNLNKQVTKIGAWMIELMKKYKDGINLICFSQGGQVCRGIIERMDHNVHTFISLSAPQGGQFGLTLALTKLFPKWVRDNIYEVLYTKGGQKFSVGNIWNDPRHQDRYKEFSEYLAVINNDRTHNRSQEYKSNFAKLKKLVLIGGPDDGVIAPWQSSQFGVFDEKLNVHNMSETSWFKDDLFGLRTLYSRGNVVTCTFPGVHHTFWHSTKPVFDKCILPYLT
ncbi:lysosomal thioesterase PPT2-A-like isoform X1 [Mercenaria mercenaria]|uniref:lysosomal thioesterase PPT2-A-like isoform X1 n=1 Tax=Mercenaria mercenaria TaxID=6596 RepID=UPI00234FAEEA|nr:lysosomal thioesterase PPT2-A-like isoform X1 [Mercenaria mercenaria]